MHLNQIDKLKVLDERLNIYQVHPKLSVLDLNKKKDFDGQILTLNIFVDLLHVSVTLIWPKCNLYLTFLFRLEHIL